MARSLLLVSALTAALTVAGCSSTNEPPVASATPFPSAAETPEATLTPDSTARSLEGTIVRFTGGGSSVDVTIANDNVTTRDFVSMLPLTLELEEFSGREKVSYLPRKLDADGAPGSDPKDGDLIYFVPWGNLGFYYDANGIGYSDDTINLGTYTATEAQLRRLENQDVTVEIVE
jgi:hypothetical protein